MSYQEYAVSNEGFNGVLQEFLVGYDLLKNYNSLNILKEKINISQEILESGMFKIKKYTAFMNLSFAGVQKIFEGLMFVFSAYLVISGQLTIGMLLVTPFILTIFLSSTAQIVEVVVQFKGGAPIREKLERVQSIETSKYPSVDKEIVFENLSFKYDQKNILEHLDLKFEKGKKYAVVGASGSGKSTVLKLLIGRLEEQGGRLLVDNETIDRSKDIDFSDEISYVSQDNYLFNMSIRDNINLGKDYSDEDIYKVLREVRLFDTINGLPEKLNTNVGSLGSQFSGGEKQRIALARALIRSTPVIVLDEATSAIDSSTTKEIEELILSKDDKTIILISHHLDNSIKEKFDHIYEIDKL